jgi:uncharacterized protein (DUF2147 family)
MRFGSKRFVVGAGLLLLTVGAASAEPIGLWRDKDGTVIRVAKCGAALCGTIEQMNPRNDPETGTPWVDKRNPSPTKRGEPLVGLKVFISMRPNGPGRWSGTLYNTDDGMSLNGHLIHNGGDVLRVEGCVGSACGGENLTRVGR